MQSIQIDGTFTYIDIVKTVKLGDSVKLIKNPNNRINKEAVGVYTHDGKKLGYIPFKSSQLDITESFYISKISLTKDNLQVLISRKYPAAGDSNIIQIEPEIIRKSLVSKQISTLFPENFSQDLKRFQKNLEKSGVKFNRIVPIYYDTNYITIMIETLDDNNEKTKNYFYLVTKEYYDKNVFKYDEFFELGLMARNIYIPFQIHRLEIYIEKNYKPMKISKKSRSTADIDVELTETKILHNIFKSKTIEDEDMIRAIIQSEMMGNSIPEDYSINLLPLSELFPNLKAGGICYNTTMKKYCYIDMYCDDMIIELIFDKPTNSKLNEMNCKLEIANKTTFAMINPIDGILYKN
jgi:hypothetical protein